MVDRRAACDAHVAHLADLSFGASHAACRSVWQLGDGSRGGEADQGDNGEKLESNHCVVVSMFKS